MTSDARLSAAQLLKTLSPEDSILPQACAHKSYRIELCNPNQPSYRLVVNPSCFFGRRSWPQNYRYIILSFEDL
jgi:hypothetical protein